MMLSLKGYLGLRGKFPNGTPPLPPKNKTNKQTNKETKTKLFSTLKKQLNVCPRVILKKKSKSSSFHYTESGARLQSYLRGYLQVDK